MSRFQTRALVEGAIFAAITVLMGIIIFYIPFFFILLYVWSVPTILIAFRHGLKVSINSVIVSSILVAVMTQPFQGLGFFIGFGVPGIFMGYLLKKRFSPWKTIFFTGLVLAVCSVASYYLGMLAVGVDIGNAYDKIFDTMRSTYRQATDSMANSYGSMGVSRDELMKNVELFEKNLEMLRLVLPFIILASGLFLSYINFKLTRLVLKRINYILDDVTPFSLWTLSDKWKLIILFTLLYSLIELSVTKLPQLNAFTMNIFGFTLVVFMILGLSVSKYYLDRYNMPKTLKVILLFLGLLILNNVFIFIGVFDMIFDLRRLQNKPS